MEGEGAGELTQASQATGCSSATQARLSSVSPRLPNAPSSPSVSPLPCFAPSPRFSFRPLRTGALVSRALSSSSKLNIPDVATAVFVAPDSAPPDAVDADRSRRSILVSSRIVVFSSSRSILHWTWCVFSLTQYVVEPCLVSETAPHPRDGFTTHRTGNFPRKSRTWPRISSDAHYSHSRRRPSPAVDASRDYSARCYSSPISWCDDEARNGVCDAILLQECHHSGERGRLDS